MGSNGMLVHLCGTQSWSVSRRDGAISPAPDAGFIHLSTPDQVHLPANRLYRGRQDLVLLYVDPDRLSALLRWEPGMPTDPDGMMFPHLYGPLPVDAVVAVVDYRPDEDGTFQPAAASPS